jgi:nucleotide-binding universal stress UspA family protein
MTKIKIPKMDAELFEIVGYDHKRYEFSDEQLAEAQRIFDRAGPSSLFWMTEIAAQLTLLATAQKNGIPTNVDYEVKEGATPEEIIDAVVKI